MNGDVLTTIDYSELVKIHLRTGATATIATKQRDEKNEFGVIGADDLGYMKSYNEKPSYHFLVSMGVYILSKKCIDLIANNEALGMPDLLLRIKENNGTIYCYQSDDYWLDIGRIDDYEETQQQFQLYRDEFLK